MYKPLDIYLPFIIIMTCWIALVVKAYIFSLQMWMLVIQEIQITEYVDASSSLGDKRKWFVTPLLWSSTWAMVWKQNPSANQV